ENAFRGIRIGVNRSVRLLDVEAVALNASDNALRGNTIADEWRGIAAALDVMDRGEIVVDDGAQTLAIYHDGVGDVGDVDEEGFIRFSGRVAVNQYIEGVGRTPCWNRLPGERFLCVVAGLHRCAVLRRDVERYPAGSGWCGEADRKSERGRAAVAFVHGDII